MELLKRSETGAALPLTMLEVEAPWTAIFFPVETIPFRDNRTVLRAALSEIRNGVMESQGLRLEVLLQFNQLHYGEASELVRTRIREWQPVAGLGIFPHLPPPTAWVPEDFTNLELGQLPRPLMYPLLHISGGPEARIAAADELFGFGSNLEVLASVDSETLLKQCGGPLTEPIRDPVFLGYPFYFPLLSVGSFQASRSGDLAKWLPGIELYMRESPEDGGILLISAIPLRPYLN